MLVAAIRNVALYVVVALFAVLASIVLSGDGSSVGFAGDYVVSVPTIAGLLVIMLAGIVCGTVFDELGSGTGPVTMSEVMNSISTRKMIRAFVISPVVFFAFLSQISRADTLVLAGLFAFQNGFFWQKTVGGQPKNESSSVQPGANV
jgi:hypothetical protein